MPAATYDFVNLIIDLPAPTGGFLTMDVQEDMYSDWKVAAKTAGNYAPPAFDTTAGDPLPSGLLTGTYFLRNDLGWRIRCTDEDQEITLNGNLYPRDASISKYIFRAGRTVSYEINLTANPRQVSAGSGLDASQDAKLTRIHTLLDVIEGTLDHQEVMRLLLAAAANKLSGAETTNVLIRDLADTKNRIDATVDQFGNRTSVTVDAS